MVTIKINHAEVGERVQDANTQDEARCDGRGDERAGAEAAHGDARDETAAIREPLDEHGDGNDVSKAETDAADNSVTEVEPPQFEGGKAGEEDAEAVEESAGKGDGAGANLSEPKAAEEGCDAQDEDADGEGEGHIGDGPVKLLDERRAKDAPGVDGSERHLHEKTCGCDAPAILVRHTIPSLLLLGLLLEFLRSYLSARILIWFPSVSRKRLMSAMLLRSSLWRNWLSSEKSPGGSMTGFS